MIRNEQIDDLSEKLNLLLSVSLCDLKSIISLCDDNSTYWCDCRRNYFNVVICIKRLNIVWYDCDSIALFIYFYTRAYYYANIFDEFYKEWLIFGYDNDGFGMLVRFYGVFDGKETCFEWDFFIEKALQIFKLNRSIKMLNS